MNFIPQILLSASLFGMAAPFVESTPIQQFPIDSSPTFPAQNSIPTVRLKPDQLLADAGSTFVSPPRTITITPGGNPQPWRDSSGRFAGSNPFGSAPRNLY
ncbi:hypothetical protein H6F87_29005 [Cyanobacteria bacterium FACHB-502]|nr:hypothetical protein [Cyanobacteria bacterium FACHB-502]